MYSFRELQKGKKLSLDSTEHKLAVLGNCATQFFSEAIEGYAKLSDFNLAVFDADYNQIDEQLLFPASDVYAFDAENILLWLTTERMYEEFLDTVFEERENFANDVMGKLSHYWELISKHSNARIIQMNFTELDDKALGSYSCIVQNTFTFQLRKLNYLLQDAASDNRSVYIVDALSVQNRLGTKAFFDDKLYYNAKMTVAMPALPYLAKAVVDVLKAITGKVKKCVIFDLDNTLWGGVIGDDGLAGIEIGELGKGHVFTNLQRWLKELKEYGIILAVCSKNDEAIAKEPFEKHEEMVLKLADISLFVANWEDKASNIRMIQESLNIGPDSIVFLDDNPFERNLVKEKLPDIEVPELPEDPAQWLVFLQEQNLFEVASYARESGNRTKQYQQEFERRKSEAGYDSIDEYLKSLEMVGMSKSFEPLRFPRIAQLTQRSNQFNLRTVRYTEDEIQRIAQDERYMTLYFTLQDKFGDHGLVSVVIMEKISKDSLFIDNWVMSCRVLKRGMEEFVMNAVVRNAVKAGYKFIEAEYIPTAKNAMVKGLYQTLGFERVEEGRLRIKAQDYNVKATFIREGI